MLVGTMGHASAATRKGWSAYLDGPAHRSYAPTETTITPDNAAKLRQVWKFVGPTPSQLGETFSSGYLASPTVADGAVFIGAGTGWFYKLSAATGAMLAKAFIGQQPQKTCDGMGVVDTATVATDPQDHLDTVYVGGPDGYLYAFNASNLALRWRSVIAIPSATASDYFQWSSPTIANGKIYIGVASNCDVPLVRGAIISYDQVTGSKLAEFYTVPSGHVGGSIWSSVAVGPGGAVYATTGNGGKSRQDGYSESILKLSPSLVLVSQFQIPLAQTIVDSDFGGSPTIFGPYVGACNKNGIYYALDRYTMKLAWQARIGAPGSETATASCEAAAIYNGHDLFLAGPGGTIKGTAYRGVIQERGPDGQLVWRTGLPEGVIGSPSGDGGGLIAVGTFDNGAAPNAVYLVNNANGRIVRTLTRGSRDFAQSVFAEGRLFTASARGVQAWGP